MRVRVIARPQAVNLLRLIKFTSKVEAMTTNPRGVSETKVDFCTIWTSAQSFEIQTEQVNCFQLKQFQMGHFTLKHFLIEQVLSCPELPWVLQQLKFFDSGQENYMGLRASITHPHTLGQKNLFDQINWRKKKSFDMKYFCFFYKLLLHIRPTFGLAKLHKKARATLPAPLQRKIL